jgi:hypothetical protein
MAVKRVLGIKKQKNIYYTQAIIFLLLSFSQSWHQLNQIIENYANSSLLGLEL